MVDDAAVALLAMVVDIAEMLQGTIMDNFVLSETLLDPGLLPAAVAVMVTLLLGVSTDGALTGVTTGRLMDVDLSGAAADNAPLKVGIVA